MLGPWRGLAGRGAPFVGVPGMHGGRVRAKKRPNLPAVHAFGSVGRGSRGFGYEGSGFCYHGVMEDELNQYLNNLNRDDSYRVEAVLKEGTLETTEVVWLVGCDGTETGPFIRKRIATRPGLGQAYGRLFDAQQRGRRFLHLPRVISCREAGESLLVVMEYVRGVTLAQLVGSEGASVGLARGLFPFVCDGVSELHERFSPPLIHRDLKPGNIMVSEGGVTLIDLGIARNFTEGAQADTCCFGTRDYAPPEQFGFGQTDERSDVYALGLILFFCLTGRNPSPADRERGYRDLCVPVPLCQVIAKAAAFDPDLRYRTVAELKAAFFDGLRQMESEGGVACSCNDAPPPQGSPWPAAAVGAASSQRQVAGGYCDHRQASNRPAASPCAEVQQDASVAAPAASRHSVATPGFWERKSLAAGILVDVLLAAMVLLILHAVVDVSFDPSPDSKSFGDPLPVRLAQNLSIGLFIMIPPLYLVADKRPLQKLSPLFKPLTKRQSGFLIAAGWVVAFVLFAIVESIKGAIP